MMLRRFAIKDGWIKDLGYLVAQRKRNLQAKFSAVFIDVKDKIKESQETLGSVKKLPNINIGESRLQNLGKFGKARLEYLHQNNFDYYRELLITSKLA